MRPIHEMQPTMKLRFVEREVIRTVSTETQNSLERVKVRILQQQFSSVIRIHTEWRDVPLEMEE